MGKHEVMNNKQDFDLISGNCIKQNLAATEQNALPVWFLSIQALPYTAQIPTALLNNPIKILMNDELEGFGREYFS